MLRPSLVLSMLLLAVRLVAQEPAANLPPGINDRFLDPQLNVAEWEANFEVESREVFAARNEILAATGLKTGDRVADVGAGTGLYTALFANHVGPTGWVYAVDIAPKFLEHIAARASEAQLSNVTPVLCTSHSTNLPPESVDLVFVCDTYHHFEFPPQNLASIQHALKPGGQLVVVDFIREEGHSSEWIMGHVRAGKDIFRSEVEAAGLEFVDEPAISSLKENYVLRFRKPDVAADEQ